MKKLVAILFVGILLSGCATIVNGRNKTINVLTSTGEQVDVDVISSNGVQTVTVPSVVTVRRANHPITINVKETKCIKPSTSIVSDKLSMWALGNVFFYIFGTTSTTTDFAVGSLWNYDDNISIPIYTKDSCRKD